MVREENYTLYSVKMIAAIAVVLIHCMLPGTIGIIVRNVARFAVPMFFIISGYFWNTSNLTFRGYQEKAIRRKRKAVKMFAYAMLAYVAFNMCIQFYIGNFPQYIRSFLLIENWGSFLCFNYVNPFTDVGHLWYLMALIYVYFVVIWVEKKNLWFAANVLSVCLIAIVFVMEFINMFAEISIPIFFYRNWLMIGFPLFTLGRYISQNEEKIKKVYSSCLVIIYLLFFCIETIFFGDNFELMPSSLLACVFLMKISCENKNIKWLSKWGKDYSQWLYIYHYFFVVIFRIMLSKFYGGGDLLRWLLPLVVVIVTIFFSRIMMNVNRKIIK